jgi:hypothetical protein
MHIVPNRHFRHHCLGDYRTLSIDSRLLVAVPKLQLIFAALKSVFNYQCSIINDR